MCKDTSIVHKMQMFVHERCVILLFLHQMYAFCAQSVIKALIKTNQCQYSLGPKMLLPIRTMLLPSSMASL